MLKNITMKTICLLLSLLPPPLLLAASKPVPIILDTDIGTDVDDAYALVLAARSPQLDLRAVTTVYGNVALRSAMTRKLLLMMGREEVLVASGEGKPWDGKEIHWGGWEGKGVLVEGETVTGVSQNRASDLIGELLSRTEEKMVIISVGGLTNIAVALRKQPSLQMKIERFVIMGGSVRPFVLEGSKIPEKLETNLHHDVEAAALVLQSGVPITLVPAEVTFQAKLFLKDFDRIRNASSPLARSMSYMTQDFGSRLKIFMKSFGVDQYYADMATLLHDPLAVYTLVDPSMMKTERVKIRIETGAETIRTIEDQRGTIAIDLVTEVDAPRFSKVVADRVLEERNAK
jgi:purine nucleosidase